MGGNPEFVLSVYWFVFLFLFSLFCVGFWWSKMLLISQNMLERFLGWKPSWAQVSWD